MQPSNSSIKNTILAGAAVFGICGVVGGCASTKGHAPGRANTPDSLPDQPVLQSGSELNACGRWSLSLHAHLSHISASHNGLQILVSTSGDSKHEGRMRFIDGRSGKVLWMRDLDQPVRSQAIARDGDWLVVNTYDGKLTAYTAHGKKMWEHEHLGRPVILPRRRLVVLFNDDDSEPKTAFATYDYSGKLLARVESDHEPLDMDTASDESLVAITTTDRSLMLYEPGGKFVAQTKLPGDSVAVRVAGGLIANAYALTSSFRSKIPQTLTAFTFTQGQNDGMAHATDRHLITRWSISTDRRYESMRLAGNTLFLYGNTMVGQALAAVETEAGAELWRHSYSNPASYSSQVFSKSSLDKPFVTAAIDEGTQAGLLHVMAIDSAGQRKWDAPVEATSGLYSYAFAEDGPALVVGAGEPGDGVVRDLALQNTKCKKQE